MKREAIRVDTMQISVLDADTINKGDLSWQEITDICDSKIYKNTKISEIYDRCKDADIIITNKVPFDKEILEKLPKLKLISVTATGTNIIDIEFATKQGIKVMNVANYSSYSVTQMVFAHIFSFSQQVVQHDNLVKQGEWQRQENFCFWQKPLFELANLNLGIIGFGNIAQIVAKTGKNLGMNIVVHSRTNKAKEFPEYQFVDLNTLCTTCDIITVHCPLTEQTKHLINKDLISLMKKTALLINTARGEIINEQALADALNNGQIAGAGLDVLSTEPPKDNNPLLKAKNCFITPHIAWATKQARQRLITATAENIRSFLSH